MKALVSGITGQDGSFLSELLLEKGYEVHGIVRRRSNPRIDNIAHLVDRLVLHTADVCDQGSIDRVVSIVRPDEFYHLAAMSFVAPSFTQPVYTVQATAVGTLHVLESIRHVSPKTKLYVAGSSEQFGRALPPHNEDVKFYPRSPYGCAKVMAHDMTRVYREAYGLFACVGILGNHESEVRGIEFLTRKVSMGVAKIKLGFASHIELGNLDARRDWGYAGDYVRAMWMMLQSSTPKDYVIGTGIDHTVRDFVVAALKVAGLEPDVDRYVKVNPAFLRPAEVDVLRLDATRAKEELGWTPTVTFNELVEKMVKSDLRKLSTDGYEVQYG